MSYVKNTWEAGDTITAAKLNNIEDGVKALEQAIAPLAATGTVTESGGKQVITLNKTAAEVYAAIAAGKSIKLTVPVEENVTAEACNSMSAMKVDSDGTIIYTFRMVNDEGLALSSSSLTGSDAVVLTEE